MKSYAIILASGTGSRIGLNIPKQFYKLKNKTILEYSIEIFEKHPNIDNIIVVSNPDFIDLTKEIVQKNNYKKVKRILPGGSTRQKSSYIGVNSIADNNAKVLIHDAVRPFVSRQIIDNCMSALDKYNAVNVAIETSDTILEIDENNFIKSIPNRKNLMRCQTPQCFNLTTIKQAHKLANNDPNYTATDDCGLILKYNLDKVYIVKGDEKNIKITYPSDLIIAENILEMKKNDFK